MTKRPSTEERDQRRVDSPRADEPQAARGDVMPAVRGIVGDQSAAAGESRSGEDVRRRGWFWHWNSIVTQFAPIIGLKGVGLLNSYTVWTDRRENSPHRGFAFPSQQSEADFYGEDRNELITINKILVALDLIEIRKVMVPRTSEAGHQWKVPHNLYRVKDHGDEFNLTVDDVRRVVELAERDRAVYRYVRRIFSPRFSPIDNANVWHDILEELRPTESWRKLALRTERDEKRASARSKAGHESRKTIKARASGQLSDTTAEPTTAANSSDDSETVSSNASETHGQTSAAQFSNGLGGSVALSNNGSGDKTTSAVDQTNTADETSVQPTSTTYYQELTTTTATESLKNDHQIGDTLVTNGLGDAPDDQRDEDATVRLFEEANAKVSTPAQRRHLRTIATGCAELAQTINVSGWKLVGEAIDEAVSSGSSFVAPKRIREILARWEREGLPETLVRPASRADVANSSVPPVTTAGEDSHRFVRTPAVVGDRDAGEIWASTCDALVGTLPTTMLDRMRRSVMIAGHDAGVVTLLADSPELAESLADVIDPVQRKMSVVMRRPVRISVARVGAQSEPSSDAAAERPSSFVIPECGMSSLQAWATVVDDLKTAGAIPRAEFDSWLRDSTMLAFHDEDDVFVIGLPHQLGVRRAERYRLAIEAALVAIVGFTCSVTFVRTQEWRLERNQAGHRTG